MSPFLHPRIDRRQYSTDSSDYLLTPTLEDGESLETQDPQAPLFKEKHNRWSLSLGEEQSDHSGFLQMCSRIPRWTFRRRVIKGACLLLIAVALVGLGAYKTSSQTPTQQLEGSASIPFEKVSDEYEWIENAPWTEAVLAGPPTSRFRGS